MNCFSLGDILGVRLLGELDLELDFEELALCDDDLEEGGGVERERLPEEEADVLKEVGTGGGRMLGSAVFTLISTEREESVRGNGN